MHANAPTPNEAVLSPQIALEAAAEVLRQAGALFHTIQVAFEAGKGGVIDILTLADIGAALCGNAAEQTQESADAESACPGWKPAPLEPTSKMSVMGACQIKGYDRSGVCHCGCEDFPDTCGKADAVYRAMLKHAPEASRAGGFSSHDRTEYCAHAQHAGDAIAE
ncbi:hypothetical protein [Bordetella flabilis]|uniref:Uncharacterized protein n=1 Tax=Bordetella flabilis TaxID=463014 RepID=A0A193G9X1_9BORD|nr:hypothetical protein [Bordetella flabilis]ANN76787.1 hypothetical protein BAU07_06375 [Bordetella flabilis]